MPIDRQHWACTGAMNGYRLPCSVAGRSFSVSTSRGGLLALLALIVCTALLRWRQEQVIELAHSAVRVVFPTKRIPPEHKAYIIEDVSLPLKPLIDLHPATHFAAAYMLVHPRWTRKGKKKCFFNNSMTLLERNWRPNNPYPLYLLTNRPWGRGEMEEIRARWPRLDLSFLDVSSVFDVLPRLDPNQPNHNNFSIEYTQMCAFNFYGFMQMPSLLQYRYLMRIDDDTCVQNHINLDLFHEMQRRKTSYGYAAFFEDPLRVIRGMNEFAAEYMRTQGLAWANPSLKALADRMFQTSSSAPCFATNWEMIDTVRYRQPDILHFLQSVKDSRMIFYRRWGDAPLRFLLAEMFWGRQEVLRFCDFKYQHGRQEPFHACEERTHVDPVLRYDVPQQVTPQVPLLAPAQAQAVPIS